MLLQIGRQGNFELSIDGFNSKKIFIYGNEFELTIDHIPTCRLFFRDKIPIKQPDTNVEISALIKIFCTGE